jgi:hypothetical protein
LSNTLKLVEVRHLLNDADVLGKWDNTELLVQMHQITVDLIRRLPEQYISGYLTESELATPVALDYIDGNVFALPDNFIRLSGIRDTRTVGTAPKDYRKFADLITFGGVKELQRNSLKTPTKDNQYAWLSFYPTEFEGFTVTDSKPGIAFAPTTYAAKILLTYYLDSMVDGAIDEDYFLSPAGEKLEILGTCYMACMKAENTEQMINFKKEYEQGIKELGGI